jgi:probable F420-dependent oxidoreductase
MHISLHMSGMPAEWLATIAMQSERLGFEGIWVSEHLFSPVEGTTSHPRGERIEDVVPPSLPLLDPLIAIAHMAAVTSRLRFGTSVYVLPLRHLLLAARVIASTQQVSGGRLLLGVGVGWLKEEYAAVGVDFATRGRRMDEMLDALQLLWSGQPVDHPGPLYPFKGVHFGPPLQRPPVIVGGYAPPALRRAAERGDGWVITRPDSLEDVSRTRDYIEDHRRRSGRSGLPFTYHVCMEGSPDRRSIERYQAAGFTNVIVDAGMHWRGRGLGLDLSGRLAAMAEIAQALGLNRSPLLSQATTAPSWEMAG